MPAMSPRKSSGRALPDGRRLGAHLPLGDGMVKAVDRARLIGARALQVFADNPTSWRRRTEPPTELPKFRARVAALDIGPIAIHAAYLINLAGPGGRLPREVRRRAHRGDAGRARLRCPLRQRPYRVAQADRARGRRRPDRRGRRPRAGRVARRSGRRDARPRELRRRRWRGRDDGRGARGHPRRRRPATERRRVGSGCASTRPTCGAPATRSTTPTGSMPSWTRSTGGSASTGW